MSETLNELGGMDAMCKPACNTEPEIVPSRGGPKTQKGRAIAQANLRQGALTHGGWRFLRRGELPMPWGEDVSLEIEELRGYLLAKCGGQERASLSGLMRIRRAGSGWGFLSCIEHWLSHRHGAAVQDKPGSGLVLASTAGSPRPSARTTRGSTTRW